MQSGVKYFVQYDTPPQTLTRDVILFGYLTYGARRGLSEDPSSEIRGWPGGRKVGFLVEIPFPRVMLQNVELYVYT